MQRNLGAILCFVIFLYGCDRDADQPARPWVWRLDGNELYSPALSADGSRVLVVAKRHEPDGHEAETLMRGDPQAFLNERTAELQANPRIKDPRIMLIDLSSRVARELDYGWSPTFSPDESSIAYAHQKNAISGFRVLAKTLEGNDIRTLDLASGAKAIVATPLRGYLAEPTYSPSGHELAYALSGPADGAYGGNLGVEATNLVTREARTLSPRILELGLPRLILQFGYLGPQLHAIEATPVSPDQYLPDHYRVDLVRLSPDRSVVATWGVLDYSLAWSRRFASAQNGVLLIFDGAWHEPSAACAARAHQSLPQNPGVHSPDGRWIARASETNIVLIDASTDSVVATWESDRSTEALTWSANSTHFAWIAVGESEPFKFDSLVVVEVAHGSAR